MSWTTPGDACPLRQNTDTDLCDFEEPVWADDKARPAGRKMIVDSKSSMVCNNCGNVDRLEGNPFRGLPAEDEDDDTPVVNPDVELAKVAAEAEADGIDLGPPPRSFYEPRMMLKKLGIRIKYIKKPGLFFAVCVIGPDEYKDVDIADVISGYAEGSVTAEAAVAEIRRRLGR